jgi:uncharacterized membrane protein YesL
MFRGFFNRMYNGNPNRPDMNPEDMPKNRFELFFTTLGVRFGDLIKLNLLFCVMLLPIVAWTFFSYEAINAGFLDPLRILGTDSPTTADMANYMMHMLMVYIIGLGVVLPLAGPPLAGLTYVSRNYARDEHAWLWSDFKEQMKKNWKQSMGVMFILAFIVYLAVVTLQMYHAMQLAEPSLIFLGFMTIYVSASMGGGLIWIMQTIFIVFICLFLLSYMYVFPMLVTYKLRIGQLLKNSLMLALGRLPFTVLFGFLSLFPLLLGVLLFLSLMQSAGGFVLLGLLLYYLLLGFSFTAFIMNSYTNATFERLLKAEDETPGESGGDREVKP